MRKQDLSLREDEIVDLAIDGLTNEAIAFRLGLSLGTVNTYWLRVRMKVGGFGRTDTVVRVLRKRAEDVHLADVEDARNAVAEIAELRQTIALLKMATEHSKATAWATDSELNIEVMVDAEASVFEEDHLGKTVYDIFGTRDGAHPGVRAHLDALEGDEKIIDLEFEGRKLSLRVVPFLEGETIAGCASLLAEA